jgi:hypothetical protein
MTYDLDKLGKRFLLISDLLLFFVMRDTMSCDGISFAWRRMEKLVGMVEYLGVCPFLFCYVFISHCLFFSRWGPGGVMGSVFYFILLQAHHGTAHGNCLFSLCH